MLKSNGILDTDLKFIADLSIHSGWTSNELKHQFRTNIIVFKLIA